MVFYVCKISTEIGKAVCGKAARTVLERISYREI